VLEGDVEEAADRDQPLRGDGSAQRTDGLLVGEVPGDPGLVDGLA
jgi:hypothetical protein